MFLYIKNCHHNDELDNYLKHDKLPHTIECSRVTCMKKLAFSLWCIVQRKRKRNFTSCCKLCRLQKLKRDFITQKWAMRKVYFTLLNQHQRPLVTLVKYFNIHAILHHHRRRRHCVMLVRIN